MEKKWGEQSHAVAMLAQFCFDHKKVRHSSTDVIAQH